MLNKMSLTWCLALLLTRVFASAQPVPSLEEIKNQTKEGKWALSSKGIQTLAAYVSSGKSKPSAFEALVALYGYFEGLNPSVKFKVPAGKWLRLGMKTFSLNGEAAMPVKNEVYRWSKQDPQIPLYTEVLRYGFTHPQEQQQVQSVFWALQQKMLWENYPRNIQEFLLEINPDAKMYVPTRAKKMFGTFLKSAASAALLGVGEGLGVGGGLVMASGYSTILRNMRTSLPSRRSRYPAPVAPSLAVVPGTALYAKSEYLPYSQMILTLFNPSSKSQKIDLSDYYLQPLRADVQRLGMYLHLWENEKRENLRALLQKTIYTPKTFQAYLDLNQIVNKRDLYEALSGKDFIKGKKLSKSKRDLPAYGLLGYKFEWVLLRMVAYSDENSSQALRLALEAALGKKNLWSDLEKIRRLLWRVEVARLAAGWPNKKIKKMIKRRKAPKSISRLLTPKNAPRQMKFKKGILVSEKGEFIKGQKDLSRAEKRFLLKSGFKLPVFKEVSP